MTGVKFEEVMGGHLNRVFVVWNHISVEDSKSTVLQVVAVRKTLITCGNKNKTEDCRPLPSPIEERMP